LNWPNEWASGQHFLSGPFRAKFEKNPPAWRDKAKVRSSTQSFCSHRDLPCCPQRAGIDEEMRIMTRAANVGVATTARVKKSRFDHPGQSAPIGDGAA
jgi:hypothetical protein